MILSIGFILSIAFLLFFITEGAQLTDTHNFLTYENPTFGITIQYPIDWQKQESDLPFINDVVAFHPPPRPHDTLEGSNNNNDTRLASSSVNFFITIDHFSEKITLDEYTDSVLDRLQRSSSDSNAIVIDSIENNTAAILAGFSAAKVVYTTTTELQAGQQVAGIDALKIMRIFTVNDDGSKAYSIEYTAQPGEEYESYLPTIQKMIDSFEILVDVTEEFQTYEDPNLGIKMQYPSDWRETSEAFFGAVVGFFPHLDNASDPYFENVRIHIENLTSSANMTLGKYVDAHITLLRNELPGFQLLASSPPSSNNTNDTLTTRSNTTTSLPTLAENTPPAYKMIVFTFGEDQLTKMMQIITIKDGKVYLIIYDAKPERFDAYLPTIQRMVDSFEFLEIPQDFITYDNPSLEISIDYHADWTVQEDTASGNVIFISPMEDEFDAYGENVLISVFSDPGRRPIEELVSEAVNSFSKNLAEFELIESKPITLQGNTGNPAHLLVYSFNDPVFGRINVMDIVTFNEDRLYATSYSAITEAFLIYLPTVQRMVDSFQIGTPILGLGSV